MVFVLSLVYLFENTLYLLLDVDGSVCLVDVVPTLPALVLVHAVLHLEPCLRNQISVWHQHGHLHLHSISSPQVLYKLLGLFVADIIGQIVHFQ